MGIMTEEEIDDILYCARANEVDELRSFLPTLFPKYGTQPAWILAQAADPNSGNTALHFASANGHIDVAKFLISQFDSAPRELQAFINRQNASGNTPLHWSALNGHADFVKLLLSHGADASILNASGHDAVYEAEMNDKQEVAELLLKEALGLERAIGGEGGKEQEDDAMEDAESSARAGAEEAERVTDGMKGIRLDQGESNQP